MGRTADSKFEQADRLDSRANKVSKRDPESAREMHDLARRTRKSAIKQMRRKPGGKARTGGTITR